MKNKDFQALLIIGVIAALIWFYERRKNSPTAIGNTEPANSFNPDMQGGTTGGSYRVSNNLTLGDGQAGLGLGSSSNTPISAKTGIGMGYDSYTINPGGSLPVGYTGGLNSSGYTPWRPASGNAGTIGDTGNDDQTNPGGGFGVGMG